VATSPIPLEDGGELMVNFSAGLAGVPTDAAEGPKALMDLADGRLLAAKRAGRGRCLAGDPVPADRSIA
jgi:PleD family two-component response regulator